MRIVLFGANRFSYLVYEKLLALKCQIAGVVTATERFRISYSKKRVKNVLYKDLGDLSLKHKIPLLKISSSPNDKAFYMQIKKWSPELMIVVGWHYKIPQRIIRLAKKGCIGIHHSLLPRYRGGAPLAWAMIRGERYSGTTLFYIGRDIDAGDIIAQKRFRILKKDTIAQLHEKANMLALEMLSENLLKIARGKAKRMVQDESKATRFPQRAPEDGLIDWNRSPKEIKNFIRAQTKPYPGAFTYIRGKKVTMWDVDIIKVRR